VTPIGVAIDENRCVELFDVTAKAADVVALMCSFKLIEEQYCQEHSLWPKWRSSWLGCIDSVLNSASRSKQPANTVALLCSTAC
jgi:hypothetical protein